MSGKGAIFIPHLRIFGMELPHRRFFAMALSDEYYRVWHIDLTCKLYTKQILPVCTFKISNILLIASSTPKIFKIKVDTQTAGHPVEGAGVMKRALMPLR